MRTFLVVVLLAQLLILHLTRSYYVAGWELLGAADGTWSIYKEGVIPSVIKYWRQSRHFQYWDSTNSLISTVLPGLLNNYLWPSLYWGHFVWFLLYCLTLCVVGEALSLSVVAVFLGLLASPVIMSYSLVGFPYLSCVIPWLLGIALLGSKANPLWWLPITELAFHCYEFGRSVFLLPLIAALTLPMSAGRRLLTTGAGGFMYWQFFVYNQSTATPRLQNLWEKYQASGAFLLSFFENFSVTSLWFPGLALLAIPALILNRRERTFWALVYLAQIGMIGVCLINGEAGLSRRFLLLDAMSLIIVARAWRHTYFKPFLGIAALASIVSTVAFVRNPEIETPLPFMKSPMDFHLNRELIDQTVPLVNRISRYSGLFTMTYGYDRYPENTTDPQGVPERVLLQVGPKLFEKRVMFLGEKRCRYSCLPMYSLEEQEAAKQKLRNK